MVESLSTSLQQEQLLEQWHLSPEDILVFTLGLFFECPLPLSDTLRSGRCPLRLPEFILHPVQECWTAFLRFKLSANHFQLSGNYFPVPVLPFPTRQI